MAQFVKSVACAPTPASAPTPARVGTVGIRAEDRLAAILRSVPSEMLPTLRGKRSARAAWDVIKTIRVGVERVRESKAQQLRREFAALTWKEGETAEDFSVRITGLANNLRTLGDNISDADVVRKMLDVVPEHLEQIAIAVETLLDLNTVSVEEEEWMAKLKNPGASGEKGTPSGSGGSGGGGNKRTGGSRGHDRGKGGTRQAAGPGDGSNQPKKTDKCYCGKKGHWAKECRSRLRDEAHLAQGEEEEEPMLMVATAQVNAISSSSPPRSTSLPALEQIHLDESKLFVQLGDLVSTSMSSGKPVSAINLVVSAMSNLGKRKMATYGPSPALAMGETQVALPHRHRCG
ncbi:hypothetical protein OsJ_22037 [Oryza sativa Japonica Group]|uniref:CCHC-type domain-containing protein n=1 Tax=Oryza sativa subsp. japonica TaxID=39947 RepID=A3BDQ6_ORYSJ|nr:hypothetical protein OsJ_22037 [Oryza sativa Japonica Group]